MSRGGYTFPNNLQTYYGLPVGGLDSFPDNNGIDLLHQAWVLGIFSPLFHHLSDFRTYALDNTDIY